MKWIWTDCRQKENTPQFAEFRTDFTVESTERTTLKISADFRYVAYINGLFAGNGQYADLPLHKSVDRFDISGFVRKGQNTLSVIAWHMGKDFSVCRTMPAAIAFEIRHGGKKVAESSGQTQCRPATGYRTGETVTPQMGTGYHLDFTATPATWQHAVPVSTGFVCEPRPVPHLTVSAPVPATVTAQGVFRLCGGNTVAEKMQNAWLRTLRFADMTGRKHTEPREITQPLTFFTDSAECDGMFVTVDLGAETCGHLMLDITAEAPCTAYIGWGEHLADLRVRTSVGGRNFASEFVLREGRNVFCDYLRRIGCRYLCLYVHAKSITVNRLSVAEVTYPFRWRKKRFSDELLRRIYETGRRTLQLCAHEHYEDCPWREQALYGMDSRNQMLFGYGAFGEYRLPRTSLKLMARSSGEDDLIPLCAPAEMSITIPSFSVYWLLAFYENTEADYHRSFILEMLPYAEKMLQVFLDRADENGVPVFTEPRYWNFHEWSPGLDGGKIFRKEAIPPAYDCALTALVADVLCKVARLEKMFAKLQKACLYETAAKKLFAALDGFYDETDGLYASYRQEGQKTGRHCYVQAAVLFAGGAPADRAAHLCEVLRNPEGRATDMTLAALPLKYDAICRYTGDTDFCVEEIRRIFGGMLEAGATSFWETACGEADFGGAGSLCHGWSAVACYVLDRYGKAGRHRKNP